MASFKINYKKIYNMIPEKHFIYFFREFNSGEIYLFYPMKENGKHDTLNYIKNLNLVYLYSEEELIQIYE